jgi:hypothetical protein
MVVELEFKFQVSLYKTDNYTPLRDAGAREVTLRASTIEVEAVFVQRVGAQPSDAAGLPTQLMTPAWQAAPGCQGPASSCKPCPPTSGLHCSQTWGGRGAFWGETDHLASLYLWSLHTPQPAYQSCGTIHDYSI